MSIKVGLTVCLSILILGCAAAGVPYTSDPTEKLNNAYYLMNSEGRALPAEKLGLEALADFKAANDIYGEAEAEHFLGTFYKSRVYRSYSDFYIKHNEYDPTAQKSISHFDNAIQAFERDGDYWGVSKSTFAMGNAYATDNDYENACRKYQEALDIYKSDKNIFMGRVHPHKTSYESYEAMINAFIKGKCKIA